jgi:glycosyltransferase involved in cell wall biosynthesis
MGEKSRTISKTKLSYVLPTYNRVEYLGECLDSLIQQDFPKDEFEIIVVDDGSTDSTPELVQFYMKDNKNLHYYYLEHRSVEYARNFGNKKAKADIIGVCDSDDIYHPLRTKITIDYFNKNPKIDLLNGTYIEITHQGLVKRTYVAKPFNKNEFFRGVGYFCHDNCAYRKDKILKVPYRETSDNHSTDDWKLVLDWMKAGYKFGYTTKELCKVRTLNKGIMGTRRAERGIVL